MDNLNDEKIREKSGEFSNQNFRVKKLNLKIRNELVTRDMKKKNMDFLVSTNLGFKYYFSTNVKLMAAVLKEYSTTLKNSFKVSYANEERIPGD